MPCVTEINDADRFFELRHVWNSVLDKCRDKNIFLTYDYLSIFWKHFAKGRRLRILVAQDGSEVIGIAPLREAHYSLFGSIGYNVVEPLAFRGADYTGFILAEREKECVISFFSYLTEAGDWDFVYLFDLYGESMIPELLRQSHPAVHEFELIEGTICPYIPVPYSVDILVNRLDTRFQKDMRRSMRNLQKDYHRVELKTSSEFGPIRKAMEMYFRLHQKRWTSRNMPGAFSQKETRDFYIDVAEHFANNGWLALYFLTADDEPIAASYNYVYDQKMYFVLGGFDPDYSRYSIGNLLLAKVLEKCAEQKIREYDLMKGGERYKFKWTDKHRRNLGIKLVNDKLISSLWDWGITATKRMKIEKIIERMQLLRM